MGHDPVDPVTCVLFDLYGTLVDIRLNEDSPALWEGLAEAIRRRGGVVENPPEVRTRFHQFLHDEAAQRHVGFLMEPTFSRLLASFKASDDVGYLARKFRELSIEEFTVRRYVAPLFDALREHNVTFGIVSNTEAVLTYFDLERCAVLRSAGTIVLSSDVGVRKPDPRIFQIALDRLNATPASSVFVGNSLVEDIEGARCVGLRAVYLDEEAPGVESPRADSSVLRVRPMGKALLRALEALGVRLH